MFAKLIMSEPVVTCRPEQSISEVLDILSDSHHRMLPVIDGDNKILGVVRAICLVEKIVPTYIGSGDLTSVAYAPDLGLLKKNYLAIVDKTVGDVMLEKPVIVRPDESLLSVSASLLAQQRFEYALVADEEMHLLGVISSNDVLRKLQEFKSDEQFDA